MFWCERSDSSGGFSWRYGHSLPRVQVPLAKNEHTCGRFRLKYGSWRASLASAWLGGALPHSISPAAIYIHTWVNQPGR